MFKTRENLQFQWFENSRYLDVVKGHTVFQTCYFWLYRKSPPNTVNEASTTPAKFALIFQEPLTILQSFSEVATNLKQRLQVPSVFLGRKGRGNLLGDITNYLAEFLKISSQMLNLGAKIGVLSLLEIVKRLAKSKAVETVDSIKERRRWEDGYTVTKLHESCTRVNGVNIKYYIPAFLALENANSHTFQATSPILTMSLNARDILLSIVKTVTEG